MIKKKNKNRNDNNKVNNNSNSNENNINFLFKFLETKNLNDILFQIYLLLEKNYLFYKNESYLNLDPIIFPKSLLKNNLNNKKVIEFYAIISAIFAFGNRKNIINFLNKLFNTIKNSNVIYSILNKTNKRNFYKINYLLNFNKIFYKKINNLKYRWINNLIISSFISSLLLFYIKNESFYFFLAEKNIKTNKDFWIFIDNILNELNIYTKFFYLNLKNNNKIKIPNIDISNTNLIDYISKIIQNEKNNFKKDFIKINSLIPSLKTSSAKRFMLFIKWCTYNDEQNLGIWDNRFEKFILYPLDTHILKKTTFFFFIIFFSYLNSKDKNSLVINQKTLNLIKKLKNKKSLILNKIKYYLKNFQNNYLTDKLLFADFIENEFNYSNSLTKDELIINLEKFIIDNIYSIEKKLNSKNIIFKNNLEDAILITGFYKIFSPLNPLKYDFSLTFL